MWNVSDPDRGRCRYRGLLLRREECTPCTVKTGRRVALQVYHCEKYGQCTLGTRVENVAGCCTNCKDYEEVKDVFGDASPVRNLLCHIYPRSGNGVWQRNVAQLLCRMKLFNGRRIVAISTGVSCDPSSHVKDQFGGHVHEFIEVPNNPSLREVATFPELFSRLENVNPRSVTFYCHSKGATRSYNHPAHSWTEMLYESLLDYWPLVESSLRRKPLSGSFKRHIKGWGESESQWHYSGSFWWMRDADLFSKPNWRRIDKFWSGIEPYLSLHFRKEDAATLFHEFHKPGAGLYDWVYMNSVVIPEFDKWKAQHALQRKEW